MISVTLDTNILVSGTFWTGSSFQILDMIDRGKISCVLSKNIVDEYIRISMCDEIIEKIEEKKLTIQKNIYKIFLNSIIVEPSESIGAVPDDPSDNKILECAVEGNVNFIITQDNHILKLKEFRGIKIVAPEEFLKFVGG